jgi:hypothetical protein
MPKHKIIVGAAAAACAIGLTASGMLDVETLASWLKAIYGDVTGD